MTRGISRRSCQSAGDKSNRSLEAASGRRPPGRSAQTAIREPEMGEEPLDDDGVVDRGRQVHPPGAARTAQDRYCAERSKNGGG